MAPQTPPRSPSGDDPGRHANRAALHRLRVQLRRIQRISWRDLIVSIGPLVILGTLAIVLTLHFVRPAPPRTLTISAGPAGSLFATTAERYRKILARDGITLKVEASTGSLANLQRLLDPHSGVDVALVQGGVTAKGDTHDIDSLGSLFYEPLVVFYRGKQRLVHLSQLRGRRIGIGVEGSGTRFLAQALLKANDVTPDDGTTRFESIEGNAAVKALLDQSVGAIFLSGDSATFANMRELLHARGIRMFDFTQADAYVRRFRYLSKLTVPPGTFDLGANLPHQSMQMLAPTVELLARDDLHPALADLLIKAAREVGARGNVFQKPGEFPAPLQHSWPISSEAQRFYKNGEGLLYRYLPFWIASLLSRLWVILVPLIVVVVPAVQYAPTLYGWRIRNRIYRRYGELMALERAALEPLSAEQRELLMQRLDEVERAVIRLKTPGAFANQLYVLRQHISFVRAQLTRA